MRIFEFTKRMKTVDLASEIPNIIERTADEAISLNQQQLYNKSVNRFSIPLRNYRTLAYSLEKYRLNPNPGLSHPDLNLTGTFYRGFYITTKGFGFTISSYDSKTPRLTSPNYYGKEIFGLTSESKRRYISQSIYPLIKTYITSRTGLRFRQAA